MNEWWARRLLRHVAREKARRRRQRDNDETTRQQFSAVVHPPQSFAHVQHKPFGYPPHLIRVKQRFTRQPAIQFDTIVANICEAWRPEVQFDTIVANTGEASVGILPLPCLAIDSSWGDLSHDYFPYSTSVFWWLRRFSEISIDFRNSIRISFEFNRNSTGMLLWLLRFYNISIVYRNSIEIPFVFNRNCEGVL